MKLCAALLALLAFSAAFPAPSAAEETAADKARTLSNTGSYVKSLEESPFVNPNGAINMGGIPNGSLFDSSTAETVQDDDVLNYQGCASVGQANYTSALFQMPEVFDKFKKDVNSTLAKQILSYNYSLPQTAALFDTLNNYGNARFQQFQQGCDIASLRKEARQQYLNSCIAKVLPTRKQVIEKAASSLKDEDKEAQAYAQAWEICSARYAADTSTSSDNPGAQDPATALSELKAVNKKFAQETRNIENLTFAISAYLCSPVMNKSLILSTSKDATATETNEQMSPFACWPTLLLPQVRLCQDSSLKSAAAGNSPSGSSGCQGDYGVNPPNVGLLQVFDILRYTVSKSMYDKVLVPFRQSIQNAGMSTNPALMKKAAAIAVNTFNEKNNSTTVVTPDVTLDIISKDMQYRFLMCSNANAFDFMKYYKDELNKIAKTLNSEKQDQDESGDDSKKSANTAIQLPEFAESDYKDVVNKWGGLLAINDDRTINLAKLNAMVIGCTANNIIPLYDPRILTSFITQQCEDGDINAFYDVAAYDVAYHSTREIYRYLSLRLKQAYGTLLNDSLRPKLPADGTQQYPDEVSDVESRELNQRMAEVIKTIMLPYIETQLERIDAHDAMRKTFSGRVQVIYREKSGCMFPKGPSNIEPRALDI